jgi:pimeloyl-ACP methyl ester carboxylesterase
MSMQGLSWLVVSFLLTFAWSGVRAAECVILLHGLARTSHSMDQLAEALTEAGYRVANIDYPSREKTIEELAEIAIPQGLAECRQFEAEPVNFVTHSLGGILVRQYFGRYATQELQRVVMLGPPNQGSEVVDKLKDVPGFKLLNGPAGQQLGTDNGSLPNRLGAVNFELGVIAGTESFNLLLSNFLPNPDDGKVSMERTKVDGMCSFTALPVTHTFMMKNKEVIEETIHFLREGRFSSPQAQVVDCTHPPH